MVATLCLASVVALVLLLLSTARHSEPAAQAQGDYRARAESRVTPAPAIASGAVPNTQVSAEAGRLPLQRPVLGPAALAALQSLEQLRDLPAGDAAIALGRELEAGIQTDNAHGYLQALLSTDHPAVERAAVSALARHADANLMLALAAQYGDLQPERRGRILEVLERAANPAALPGLAGIVAADTTEKRSPLVMSAMYGAAHLGTVESIQYLLGQLTPQGADFALMALERVTSPQGVQMLREAAAGSKDAALVPTAYREALRRIAVSTMDKG